MDIEKLARRIEDHVYSAAEHYTEVSPKGLKLLITELMADAVAQHSTDASLITLEEFRYFVQQSFTNTISCLDEIKKITDIIIREQIIKED